MRKIKFFVQFLFTVEKNTSFIQFKSTNYYFNFKFISFKKYLEREKKQNVSTDCSACIEPDRVLYMINLKLPLYKQQNPFNFMSCVVAFDKNGVHTKNVKLN